MLCQLPSSGEGVARVRRPSGRPDWLASVSRVGGALDHLPARVPALLIRILEPENRRTLSKERAALFGLTAREIEIGDALLEGHSLESLAAALNISRNTARVHLQSLFRKTGTTRQSQLLLLLSRLL